MALNSLMRALLMLACEKLVRRTHLCLITQQNNNKSAAICMIVFLYLQRRICLSFLFCFSHSTSFLHQPAHYSSHLFLRIYLHIMLHLHISPLWSILKCYFKSLFKKKKRGKKDQWTDTNTVWLIFNLKGHEWTEDQENKRFSRLWQSHKET